VSCLNGRHFYPLDKGGIVVAGRELFTRFDIRTPGRTSDGAGLIEEVRSVRRKLLFMAVGAALLAVPVALVLFRAPPVNLTSSASTLKCYDKTGNLKAC
jgi:hypothetical protein